MKDQCFYTAGATITIVLLFQVAKEITSEIIDSYFILVLAISSALAFIITVFIRNIFYKTKKQDG